MADLRTAPIATVFDLEEFRTEHDRVVVRGRWSGTRGMRFVRPTLLVGEREVLATLDHKPWAPDAGVLWTAAFPWKGTAIEPQDAALAVTPAVTVPLVAGGRAAPEPTPPAPVLAVEDTAPPADRGRELDAMHRRLARVERERDQALAEQHRERQRADDAVAAQRRAQAQRDVAVRQVGQAREARDETLVAYRALERRLRVGDDSRASVERPERATAGDEEVEPLGVVAGPAAREPAGDVHHPDRPSARPVTDFDLWAVRILGSVAAVCILGLMLLLALAFA